MRVLALVLLLGGVQKGHTLFIKGADVVMRSQADGTGEQTPLKNGDEVQWQERSRTNKSMHRVVWQGKQGYVPESVLTPNKPADPPTPPAPRRAKLE